MLGRRESEVIGLVTIGLPNKQIALQLKLAEGTVKVYLSKLFRKLGVKNRLDLAFWGVRNMGYGRQVTTAAISGFSNPL
jgi:DNA-binding NarL/FixJ family response regulator